MRAEEAAQSSDLARLRPGTRACASQMPETAARFPYKHARTLKGHRGAVNVVLFNADGKYCMSGGKDKNVVLWNPVEGTRIKAYSGAHGYEVLDVSIRTDNAQFASVGGDRVAYLWDVKTGQTLRRLRNGHDRRINACELACDGQVLLTASDDESVCAWDLRSRSPRPIQKMKDFKDSVSSVTVAGDAIVTASVDGCVRYFDMRMGQVTVDHVGEAITSLQMSNDDQCVLVSCLDNEAKLFDRTSGELLCAYRGHQSKSYRIGCAFSCDDAYVVSGSEDGSVFIWNLVEGSVAHKIPNAHYRAVSSIAYHPKGVAMLTASADGMIKLWTGPPRPAPSR